MSPRSSLLVLVVLAALAGALAVAVPAAAQERLVTYAARTCPEYTDITANLARNNIQESLRDLGADTAYVSGEAISPSKEAANQPNCTPIIGWPFVLGTGYQTRAVTGPWGSLSKVLNPYSTSIVTKATTPLLNSQGVATGQQIAGAVTVALTDDQAQRATSSNSLWVQGGTVDDPVQNTPHPGQYGFGALRCAIDNLNGDNVEWIAYPQGARHVFCFAYYVTPPPSSGTIIVRKVVDDPDATSAQTFTYEGNISYTEDHTFSLTASNGSPGSMTFFRGATVGSDDPPWSFTERETAGWERTGLACTSKTGGSTSTTSVATGAASVQLAAGDTVTCTYTNRLKPPPAGLQISKVTLGGTGSFDFSVAGGGVTKRQTITTADERVPVAAPALSLKAGAYTITETLPDPSPAGRWHRTRVVCDGAAQNPLRPVDLALTAGEGSSCLFTNTFVPAGVIRLSKVTLGGTGTFGFQVRRVGRPARSYDQEATTRTAGVPARATGDRTDRLALGTYDITETGPPPTAEDHWNQEFVLCDGRPVGASQGKVRVRITSRDPSVSCTFGNRLITTPEPEPPTPTPTPDGGGSGQGGADGPYADLAVTKTVSPGYARPGQPVVYTVRVTNNGPDAATDVVAAELNATGTRTLSITTSRGTCRGTRPAGCRFGTLKPGQSVTVRVRATAPPRGTRTNRVGVLASSKDPNLRNNRAVAAVQVRPFRLPAVTG